MQPIPELRHRARDVRFGASAAASFLLGLAAASAAGPVAPAAAGASGSIVLTGEPAVPVATGVGSLASASALALSAKPDRATSHHRGRLPELEAGAGLHAYASMASPAETYAATAAAPSPSPAVNFLGLLDDDRFIPPDTDGAVGPAHVMTALNSQTRILNRTGTVLSTVTTNQFWNSVLPTGSTGAFDPHVAYDPAANRWIYCAVSDAQSSKSSLCIAVSQTSDPTGGWNMVRFLADASATMWADYPMLGFNKDWIVVSLNMFPISSGSVRGQVYVFNKANLYAGSSSGMTVFSSSVPFGLQPAVTYDSTLGVEYLVRHYSSASGIIYKSTITGSPPSAPVLTVDTAQVTSTLGGWAVPGYLNGSLVGNVLPQAGTAAMLDGGDARMINVVVRTINGATSIWCAQNIALPAGTSPTHMAAQWWRIDGSSASSSTVQQQGRLEDSSATVTNGGRHYAYPSVAVNSSGDLVLGCSRFQSTAYPSATYAYRAAGDTGATLRDDVVYKAGEGAYDKDFGYGEQRWGDYSATWVDPVNDTDFWTIQEYAAAPIGSGSDSGQWGTWWAKIAVSLIITSDPQPQSALAGGTATFAVGATGVAPLSYQWQRQPAGSTTFANLTSSTTYSGVTTATLTVTGMTSAMDGDQFRCVVKNGVGDSATSQAAALSLYRVPVITAASNAAQVATLNGNLTISVTSPTATSFQWSRNGIALSGGTNSSLNITNAKPWRDNGWYQAVATNPAGSTAGPVIFVNVSGAQVVAWGDDSSGQTDVPSGLATATAVSAGATHSLALKANGTVVAWGSNSFGQCSVPSSLTGVVAIAAGNSASLALKSDGTVVGWGNVTVPAGLANVVAIAADYHYLALKSDGTVVGFGPDDMGQTDIPTGLAGVIAVAANGNGSLALKSNGTVVAWGSNLYGQASVPSGLTSVTAIANADRGYALKSDASVKVWGAGLNVGQTRMPDGQTGVAAITARGTGSAALMTSGTLNTWGAPTPPAGLYGIVGLAQGTGHFVALRDPAVPAITSAASATFTVGQANRFAVAVTGTPAPSLVVASGTFPSWATLNATTGEITGTPTNTTGSPFTFTLSATNSAGSVQQTFTLTVTTGAGIIAVDSSGSHTLFLRSDGTVWGMGDNSSGQLGDGTTTARPTPLLMATNAINIAAGAGFSMIVKADGTLWAVGNNAGGALGDGTYVSHATLEQVGTDVIAVSAGAQQTLFLKTDGTLWGMGSNANGELGLGSPSSGSPTPLLIASHVAAASAGGGHSVFVKTDGSLWATGNNAYGELGDGTTTTRASPVKVATGVSAAAAGSYNTLFLKYDGTLWGMGTDFSGALANKATPIQISTGVAAFSAGYVDTMFVKSDHGLWAAGASADGEFGNGSNVNNQSTPVLVATNMAAVRVALYSSYFIKTDGSLWASGKNDKGQLGDGSTTGHLSAVAIASGAVTAPAVPTGVSASEDAATGAAVYVTWQPTIGATAYEVWRGSSSGSAMATLLASNVTAPRYEDIGATPGATYYYFVRAVNATSGSALSIADSGSATGVAPAFTLQPANVSTVVATGSATFRVAATGIPTPSFQWQRLPAGGTAFADLANNATFTGVTTPTLVMTAPTAAMDGDQFRCVANNAAGSTNSAAATLTVANPAPVILAQGTNRSVGLGGSTTFLVSVTSPSALTYQWRKNQSAISGATSSQYMIPVVASTHAGNYDVVITNGGGTLTSATMTLTVLPNPIAYSARQLVNGRGVRAYFAIEGSQSKHLLVRALGPALTAVGVVSPLADPTLTIFDANGQTIGGNDNWGTVTDVNLSNLFAQVGATPLAAGSKDAAYYVTLEPGTYAAQVTGVGGANGIALLELFDTDTNPLSRIAYVGVQSRVEVMSGPASAGLTMANSASKRFLVRAVGPAGGEFVHPDPQLNLYDGTVLALSNDNWGGLAALTTAATQAGAFTLASTSLDAAILVDQRVGTGVYTAQVPVGPGGDVLIEFYDIAASGSSAVAPAVIVSPVSKSAEVGHVVVLRALGTGTGPLAYQWRKAGVPLTGQTNADLVFSSAQLADTNSYDVVVTNSLGSATSAAANLAIVPVGTSVTDAVSGTGYVAGGNVTITNTITYTGTGTSLGFEATLPPGWTFATDGASGADIVPHSGDSGTIAWVWTTVPASPVTFTYTVNAPASALGAQVINARAVVRTSDGVAAQPAAAPLLVPQSPYHSADENHDFRISLIELTRVIELYNTRNGTSRTGCYTVQAGTEDGFAPDATRSATATVTLSAYHSADENRDGKINLVELTRVIELYNYRVGTSRTGQYHIQAGTEDGFAPGP